MDEPQSLPRPAGSGFLVVQVTTANSAIPLAGASVTIRAGASEGADILYQLRSGPDGRTARVTLAAPPRADSQRPAEEKPYATYEIEVSMPYFTPAEYHDVPIFDGITAIQQANLVPVPDNGRPDPFTLDDARQYETGAPEL